MANNRMALVCKDCKVGIAIAKYYPMGEGSIGGVDSEDNAGWYQQGTGMQDFINKFFIKHKHEHDFSMSGASQYYLGYEDDEKDWKYE